MKQQVTIGRVVIYTLSESDAAEINRRRTTPAAIAERIGIKFTTMDGTRESEAWPLGAQAHIGNEAQAGQEFPAIVVAVWGAKCCNLKVMLDGTDTFWATSRSEFDPSILDADTKEPLKRGTWDWPQRT